MLLSLFNVHPGNPGLSKSGRLLLITFCCCCWNMMLLLQMLQLFTLTTWVAAGTPDVENATLALVQPGNRDSSKSGRPLCWWWGGKSLEKPNSCQWLCTISPSNIESLSLSLFHLSHFITFSPSSFLNNNISFCASQHLIPCYPNTWVCF